MIVAGCASTTGPGGKGAAEGLSDPLEKINRVVFKFNLAVDDAIGKPLAKAYKKTIPRYARNRIRNFLEHYASPVTFINDLLQGEVKRAQITFVRFVVNTMLGVGGLYDRAAMTGLPGHKEDFGQTLAVWGVPSGPYLMVPLLGPHTTRHAAGRLVDSRLNPFSYLLSDAGVGWIEIIGTVLDFTDRRARLLGTLDKLRKNSLDFYAVSRNLYWQNRKSQIRNGKIGKIPLPGEDDDDDGDRKSPGNPPKKTGAKTSTKGL